MVTWTRISVAVHQLIFLVAGRERLCDCHWLGGQTQAMHEDKHGKQAAWHNPPWVWLLNKTTKAALTSHRGFETMSISEIYGEFRMFFISQSVYGILNRPRLWKDTDLPYDGCHGPAAKGNKMHPYCFNKELTKEIVGNGRCRRKGCMDWWVFCHVVTRTDLTIGRYRGHVSSRANCADCWALRWYVT